jgi:adenylate cyclase
VTERWIQRRLAAILAADVVGYSALMERAEEATYAEFERLKRELIEPNLSRHEGRLIKTTGDGALAEFASPWPPRDARLRYRINSPLAAVP